MHPVNLFKALSDETRIRLLHLSLHFELNVNEIVKVLGMGQSRISHHLKILTESGLITHRRVTQMHPPINGVMLIDRRKKMQCENSNTIISFIFTQLRIYVCTTKINNCRAR